MTESIKITCKDGKIRTVINNMTPKHIDDAIRELKKIRLEMAAPSHEPKHMRGSEAAAAAPRVITPVPVNRSRREFVVEGVLLAVVGTSEAAL